MKKSVLLSLLLICISTLLIAQQPFTIQFIAGGEVYPMGMTHKLNDSALTTGQIRVISSDSIGGVVYCFKTIECWSYNSITPKLLFKSSRSIVSQQRECVFTGGFGSSGAGVGYILKDFYVRRGNSIKRIKVPERDGFIRFNSK